MLKLNCLNTKDEANEEQKHKNSIIEQRIQRDKEVSYREVKILLLGPGGSGKSTVIKQMRMNHGCGYQERDRMDYIPSIHRNIFVSIMSLIKAMETLEVGYDDELCEEYIETLKDVGYDEGGELSDDHLVAIQHIWRNAGIQGIYEKQSSFHLIDSAKYYLDSIDRIKDPHFIPSVDDVLRARMPSCGVKEYNFNFHGVNIRMIDVGGQKTERNKWINCFDDVTSVLFVAALTEYDMPGIDDEKSNRLIETRSIFALITSIYILKQASLILFLNKLDNFENKIQYSHLGKYFPDYAGPENDAEQAKKFISKLFFSANAFPNSKRIYSHFTCATNTDDIEKVFLDIKDTILDRNMKDMSS